MKRSIFVLAILAVGGSASAQTYTRQATPDPGQYVPVFAQACQDASGRALPPGSANCAQAAPTTVQGTVTSNQGAPNAGGAQAWWVQWSGMSVAVSSLPSIPTGSNVIGAVTQSGGPWSVSGTVNAAQSGAYTVTQGPGGSAAWKVDGSGVTQPVSAVALPLPAGASTAAGQAAQQGPVAPGTAAANSVLGACIYNAAAPGPTSGQQLADQCDGAGTLKINNATLSPGAATSANQGSEIAALGATGDAAYAGSGAASIVASLKGVYNATLAPLAAGSNIIGKVGIDQTTAGTTNGVVVNASVLPTGAATASGQTAPLGSTTGGTVAANSALAGGVYNATPPALTSGQQAALQFDAAGDLKVLPLDNASLGTVTAAANGTMAGTANTATSGVFSTTGFASLSIQFTSYGSGTVTFLGSNDGTNWTPIVSRWSQANGTYQDQIYTNSAGAYVVPASTALVRMDVSSYGSGTMTAKVVGKVAPAPPSSVNVVQTLGANAGNPSRSVEVGSPYAADGIAPVVATGATAAVGKAAAGNLYSAYAVATTAPSAQQYLVAINATAAPSSGATIAPVDFAPFSSASAVGAQASVNFGPGPPDVYSSGIVLLVSTSLTTYTPGSASAINVRVR